MPGTLRTVAALAGLAATAPLDLAAVAVVAAWGGRPATKPSPHPRTVLLTGGKMTKALQLARSFHLAGHRVVLVESARYRWTGHRFSRAVDAFHVVPDPDDPGYAHALLDVVLHEQVDVLVPVASPAASIHDADARQVLDGYCEVLHGDGDVVRLLDDKSQFSEYAASLGLRVPDWLRVTDPRQVEEFEFLPGREYILKRIAYDPVGRMDLTRLTAETPERNSATARSRGISEDDPFILQEFIAGREYCTHGTVRDGHLQVYGCCESSAFQVNYEMVDHPGIRAWVTEFVGALGVSGQLSFDFIESARDGEVYAIECNPRTHSAITMFHDHPDVAAAYLDDGHPVIEPLAGSRPTYWTYHEAWRLLTEPARAERLRTIWSGKDAILTGWDPMPYLLVHHLQIPSLLVDSLRRRATWSRIDFNIGKLVEDGGD
ncbi:ATP-grasp enzyme [Aeromicrobium endophyticum]|uniref:ATP-grasp enzyme n=1 Tax=Aeromicrobium endophyticum TaxID=2292704 RepID=A0A371PA07_9ACTN|nr:ATP-grasp enzyme [Aeromicrobium endophyticum]REK72761.1 ATP-grasp enzyme [Aeromicrobium endophyticum]